MYAALHISEHFESGQLCQNQSFTGKSLKNIGQMFRNVHGVR